MNFINFNTFNKIYFRFFTQHSTQSRKMIIDYWVKISICELVYYLLSHFSALSLSVVMQKSDS